MFDHCDSSLRVAGPAGALRTAVAEQAHRRRLRGHADAARRDRLRAGRPARALAVRPARAARARRRIRDAPRSYPDFAQVARYAWLAGDRRLQEIGIKTYQQRGEGTDFKQLAEYRYGDPVRHIDWKATLRQNKPILREFQDERDQCVMLLIDCGRRMRAYDADSDDRQRPLRPGAERRDAAVVRRAQAGRCGRRADLRHAARAKRACSRRARARTR